MAHRLASAGTARAVPSVSTLSAKAMAISAYSKGGFST
jgi:hypothetical protein